MRRTLLASAVVLLFGATNAIAATYYVKPDGDDNARGTSDETAWRTIGKVNSFAFETGDDVYFRAGGEWKGQLVIDWGGTDANRAVVGSYYMDGGQTMIGVPANTAKPVLVGGYPLVDSAGAVPRDPYSGLIQANADYVTVQNMKMLRSSGYGFLVNKRQHHVILADSWVDTTAGGGVMTHYDSHDNIIRNNELGPGLNQGWKDGVWIGSSWSAGLTLRASWRNVVENNYMHECYGEGINAFGTTSDHNVIRNNLLVWIRSANVYIDNGADNLVENNIVIGNGGNGQFKFGSWEYSGTGFAVNVEDYATADNAVRNVIRNNLVAGAAGCFDVGMNQGARDSGYLVGGEFVGNTCVGTMDEINIWVGPGNIDSVRIAGNIFSDSDSGAGSCESPTSSKIAFQNNLWGVAQRDADCRSSGDLVGDPGLNRATGWRDGGPENIFEATDFRPVADSPVFGAGRLFSVLTKDYFGSERPNPPAIGAIENSETRRTVAVPSGLVLKVP